MQARVVTAPSGELIRGVRRPGTEDVVDIRIVDGVIAEIGPDLAHRGSTVHDAAGLWAVPGLWDQHVHVGQTAMASQRIDTSRARTPEELYALVAREVATRSQHRPGGADTIQGFGHRSATWAAQPSVAGLDGVAGGLPVVLISGDAHHGVVSTAALEVWGLPPREGAIVEDEWFALFGRFDELPGVGEAGRRGVAQLITDAHARGVVGLVDFEWTDNLGRWRERVADGLDSLRIRTAVYADGLESVITAGLRTGDPVVAGSTMIRMGPLKIISDGSLNTRTAFCCQPYAGAGEPSYGRQNTPPEELTALLGRAHTHGLTAAVHAIGDAAVRDGLDAFAGSGASGTIEHAQLITVDDVTRLARSGVAASVQPAHLLDDRDVTEICWPDRLDRCFVFASMLAAGVDVRFGSDAPVAPLDPWLAMAAAVHRSADGRPPWAPEQHLSPATALRCSTDGIATLAVGGPGDIVLTTGDPTATTGSSAEDAARLRETEIIATLVAGRLVFQS